MINKITKLTTFLSAALISLAATSSFAAQKIGKTYGDWVIVTEKNEQTKKTTTFLQQVLSSTDEKSEDKKPVQLAVYRFLLSDKKELILSEVIPQGALLQPGTALFAIEKLVQGKDEQEGKFIATGKYTVCQNTVCEAVAPISDQDLKTIVSSEAVYLSAVNLEGKQVNFQFSVKGLKEGIAALKAK